MTYKTGHIPDHPEVVKKRAGLHLYSGFALIIGLASNLPMATQNRVKLGIAEGGPGILNQRDVGACEGFAHGGSGTVRLNIMGVCKGLISPVQLYLGALLFDQVPNVDGTLPGVTDTGTMPGSINLAWQTFGAVLAKDDPLYPCSSANLYVDPSNPNSLLKLPPPEQLYADGAYRYNGMFFITAGGTQRTLQVLTTLASGRPITDAIPASGSQFQQYTGGVLGTLSGPIDHANYIIDYEWTGSAADWQTFITALQQNNTTQAASLAVNLILHCVNSWDVTWGESDAVAGVAGGMYRANIDYLNQAEDLSVVDLKAAA